MAEKITKITRRQFLPLLGAGTIDLLLGCQSQPQPTPERKYKVESLSMPPTNPEEFFKRVNLPEKYKSLEVDVFHLLYFPKNSLIKPVNNLLSRWLFGS